MFVFGSYFRSGCPGWAKFTARARTGFRNWAVAISETPKSDPPHHDHTRQPATLSTLIPVFRGFASLMDPALYSPLPDDWTIGIADIVESTKAIADTRYKAVNMAGPR